MTQGYFQTHKSTGKPKINLVRSHIKSQSTISGSRIHGTMTGVRHQRSLANMIEFQNAK